MFYLREAERSYFVTGADHFDDTHHFLIAGLTKHKPWCYRCICTSADGKLSFCVNPDEFQLLCTQVTSILASHGFTLDGLYDNKWIFVKRT